MESKILYNHIFSEAKQQPNFVRLEPAVCTSAHIDSPQMLISKCDRSISIHVIPRFPNKLYII